MESERGLSRLIAGLFFGFVIGAVTAAVVFRVRQESGEPTRPEGVSDEKAASVTKLSADLEARTVERDVERTRAADLTAKVSRLEEEISDLKVAAATSAAAPAGTPASSRIAPPTGSPTGAGPTAADSPPAEGAPSSRPDKEKFRQAFLDLAKKGLFALESPDYAKLVEDSHAMGAEGIAFLGEQLTQSESASTRFLAASLFEELGNATALPYLQKALRDDKDFIVRRMCSHAIAVGRMKDGYPDLETAMVADPDWGVKVNSAYGLAKDGNVKGLDTLVKYFESPDTEAQYRLSIYGGIIDVADPRTAPLIRRTLVENTDPTFQLLSIKALEKMKDREALDLLRNIITQSRDDTIKEAAKTAYNEIVGQEVYR
jgi:hypothetical protein